MSIIREKDLELFSQHIDKIQEDVKKKTWNLLEPTGDTKMEIVNKVLEFIKKKKRKIYGSYSHNKVIVKKNKKDGFLSDLEVPDIDFYSPDPLQDLYEICNMFHKLGYNDVVGREAQHAETYKIFVDEAEACDISYVPNNIYNKIPYIEIDGINYVHPNWAIIDYLRILTDPMTSWEIKLDKRFKRYFLLQKHYPLPSPQGNIEFKFKDDREKMISLINKIYRYILDRPSILVTGIYAYNYYLYEATNDKKKVTDINYYELISSDYQKDAKEIIGILKDSVGSDIKVEEHYPFFQFTDFSARIYYKNNLICVIYGNNKKCLPYHKVKAIYFENNKAEKNEGTINLVSFNLLILNNLVNFMYWRIQENNKYKDLYMSMISNLIKMRNDYLDSKKKNIFEGGIFSDFVIECLGETISARKEQNLRYKENIEKGRPGIFSYKPSQTSKNEAHDFQFKNSSGNKINNDKNLKLS